jgi:hypothetical protein
MLGILVLSGNIRLWQVVVLVLLFGGFSGADNPAGRHYRRSGRPRTGPQRSHRQSPVALALGAQACVAASAIGRWHLAAAAG